MKIKIRIVFDTKKQTVKGVINTIRKSWKYTKAKNVTNNKQISTIVEDMIRGRNG